MRLTLSVLLPLLLLPTVLAPPPREAQGTIEEEFRDITVKDTEPQETFFNGQAVPPIIDLSGETLKQDIRRGYW